MRSGIADTRSRPGRTRPPVLALALVGLVLPSFGCGSSDGDPTTLTAADLSGWWEGFAVEVATGERHPDEGFQVFEFLGVGSNLSACGDTVTVMNGMITDPSSPGDLPLSIIDASTIIGSATIPGVGAIEVKYTRRTQAPPTGTLDLMGTVFGGPFTLVSGVPRVQVYEEAGLTPATGLTEIEVLECGPMRKETALSVRVNGATRSLMTGMPFTVVPFLTGAAGEAEVVLTEDDGGFESAISGTITFTQGALMLGSRPAATFTLMMSGGGMLTGSFEAEVFGIDRE